MRRSVASSMLLFSRSDTPFWATVKSARPVCMIARALARRLWLTMLNVTTVITPTATASEASASRSFLTATLCAISPRKVSPPPARPSLMPPYSPVIDPEINALADPMLRAREIRARNGASWARSVSLIRLHGVKGDQYVRARSDAYGWRSRGRPPAKAPASAGRDRGRCRRSGLVHRRAAERSERGRDPAGASHARLGVAARRGHATARQHLAHCPRGQAAAGRHGGRRPACDARRDPQGGGHAPGEVVATERTRHRPARRRDGPALADHAHRSVGGGRGAGTGTRRGRRSAGAHR